MKRTLALCASVLALLLPGTMKATSIVGGDAADQASATSILDIVFVIDTSGSMTDDIANIASTARTTIENLECPDCDVWIRARFFGITGNSGTLFNENIRSYLLANARVPLSVTSEDNGHAVRDIIANPDLFFNDDSVGTQQYFKAVVTIGDEGLVSGSPVNVADWNSAVAANSAAVANDVLLFSWVTDDPFAGVPEVFSALAIGGVNPFGGPNLQDTGGAYFQTVSNTAVMTETLEDILCIAGSGGTGVPDHGSSALLVFAGLLSLRFIRRK